MTEMTEEIKKTKKGKLERNRIWMSWTFVLIPTLFIITFYFYPMIQAFWISLHTGTGVNLDFTGLDNYRRLFNDQAFITAVTNTFIFFIFQIPLMIILALFFSVLLNQKTLHFKGIFRTLVFLPAITSLVAYSLIFRYLFSNDGVVNQALMFMNLIDAPIFWLGDPFWAKVLIIIAITWRWTGYNMIFYLSALQNIDPGIYEAARIDGASAVQQFFRITIPMLRPVILFTSITSTIGTLQLFDEPMNLTGGGPGNATTTISQYIYNLSFEYTPNFGYAAAVSYSIVVFVLILSAIQFRVGRERK
ncbi:lactose/L-arabinose transport system permease protein [Alkalibacterium subtropicum]|uniref:Lactose/L-arabinose transport system permease protein n=2 Tax=Alkalibacterium subtropicum TaxID=753702 RepID=A0A1I1GBP6_9LACT|nr:lactose/L-arabinose transport system permease protein [Alkalibacterium subtropicum]